MNLYLTNVWKEGKCYQAYYRLNSGLDVRAVRCPHCGRQRGVFSLCLKQELQKLEETEERQEPICYVSGKILKIEDDEFFSYIIDG
ncbi:MAG: hypothetical protein LIO86_02350, partial [Lachnospiraceae bacterium]|nr:hypothetical protein [Lachnospiraceae bacterium]